MRPRIHPLKQTQEVSSLPGEELLSVRSAEDGYVRNVLHVSKEWWWIKRELEGWPDYPQAGLCNGMGTETSTSGSQQIRV